MQHHFRQSMEVSFSVVFCWKFLKTNLSILPLFAWQREAFCFYNFLTLTLFRVIFFFSTNIPVFLTVISRGRMHFIWPKQNASCWLRMASGGFAVTFVLPKEKIFRFLFNLNIPPPILFIGLPNGKVFYFQRSSFKTSAFIRVAPVPWGSFDGSPGGIQRARLFPCEAFQNALPRVSLHC